MNSGTSGSVRPRSSHQKVGRGSWPEFAPPKRPLKLPMKGQALLSEKHRFMVMFLSKCYSGLRGSALFSLRPSASQARFLRTRGVRAIVPQIRASVVKENEGNSAPEPAEDLPAASPPASVSPTFETLKIHDFIAHAMRKKGIQDPSPIQSAAYTAISTRRDLAIKSYTGSGKTYAYLLPVLNDMMQRVSAVRRGSDANLLDAARRATPEGALCLVVAPTADLAMQIVRAARMALPQELHPLVMALIGGANMKRQVEVMKDKEPWIVVGTPGRLADMSRQGLLRLHPIPMIILDEADQLLSSTYLEDVKRLTEHTGKRAEGGRQTVLVSATITPGSLRTAEQQEWCKPGCEILSTSDLVLRAKRPDPTLGKDGKWNWDSAEEGWAKESGALTEGAAGGVGVDDVVQEMPPNLLHLYVRAPEEHRVDRVRKCMYAVKSEHCLVFMNFQRRLRDTEEKLRARGVEVASLHGEMTAQQRRGAVDKFREGKVRALVVSDVAARGIDFPACDVVFNLELPSSAAHYVHRAGRAGRAGREGVVISIVPNDTAFVIKKWAKELRTDFVEVQPLDGELVPIEDFLDREAAKKRTAAQREQREGGRDKKADKADKAARTADKDKDPIPAASKAAAVPAEPADDEFYDDDDFEVEGQEGADGKKPKAYSTKPQTRGAGVGQSGRGSDSYGSSDRSSRPSGSDSESRAPNRSGSQPPRGAPRPYGNRTSAAATEDGSRPYRAGAPPRQRDEREARPRDGYERPGAPRDRERSASRDSRAPRPAGGRDRDKAASWGSNFGPRRGSESAGRPGPESPRKSKWEEEYERKK